jgi:hypothetical protein
MTAKTGKAGRGVFAVGVVLSVLGVGWGALVVPRLLGARATSSWPTVEGVVTSSEVRMKEDSSGDARYVPEITYRYTVDGVKRSSDRIAYASRRISSRSDAREIADRYPVGEQVRVHYDPDDPYTAVLEPGASSGAYIAAVVAGAFMLGGVLVIARAFAPKRPSQFRTQEPTTRPELRRLVFGIGALAFLGMGIAALILGAGQLKEARASKSWPSVQGIVVSSSVQRSSDHDDRDYYQASVVYEYAVGGVTYSCNRISYGTTRGRPEDAREEVKRYPKGKPVEVYYDPDDPDAAILEPGKAGEPYLWLGLGGAFTLVGLVGLGLVLFKRKSAAASEGEDTPASTYTA